MFKRLVVVAMVLMLFIAVQAGRANADLVQNGNFAATPDFTNWTLSGDTSWVFVLNGTPRTPGGSYAEVGSPASISQAINTTAGQAYAVSFWLANDFPGTNEFKALWNGVTEKIHLLNVDAFGWTQYQYTGTASGAATPISFSFQNDASVFKLTDVSAAPVPIPGALLLFGPGLAGLIVMKKRFIG